MKKLASKDVLFSCYKLFRTSCTKKLFPSDRVSIDFEIENFQNYIQEKNFFILVSFLKRQVKKEKSHWSEHYNKQVMDIYLAQRKFYLEENHFLFDLQILTDSNLQSDYAKQEINIITTIIDELSNRKTQLVSDLIRIKRFLSLDIQTTHQNLSKKKYDLWLWKKYQQFKETNSHTSVSLLLTSNRYLEITEEQNEQKILKEEAQNFELFLRDSDALASRSHVTNEYSSFSMQPFSLKDSFTVASIYLDKIPLSPLKYFGFSRPQQSEFNHLQRQKINKSFLKESALINLKLCVSYIHKNPTYGKEHPFIKRLKMVIIDEASGQSEEENFRSSIASLCYISETVEVFFNKHIKPIEIRMYYFCEPIEKEYCELTDGEKKEQKQALELCGFSNQEQRYEITSTPIENYRKFVTQLIQDATIATIK